MSEALKIGVVYRDHPPQLCSDIAPGDFPWPLEYFQEETVLGEPVEPQPDFLAVFFPSDEEGPKTAGKLANVFPGAELVGFRNSLSEPVAQQMRSGLPVVPLPMRYPFLYHFLQGIAASRDARKELAKARRRADDLTRFFQGFVNIVESAWTVTERKQSLTLLIKELAQRLRAEECLIYYYNEVEDSLSRAYSTGNLKGMDLFDHHANSALIESVIRSGRPYLDNDYSFELKAPLNKQSALIRSILCVPLLRGSERIGAIELLNKEDRVGFAHDDAELVELLGHPLAVALRNVSMFENSERLTVTDDLTKLYNYRYLMQYLDAEVKRCLRYKKKVSLLFIDIDGFKRINDRFGHVVGSQALSEMGQVFRKILRETDIVGRYGGDEFVIVLPETPLNGAMVIAERIRQKVENYEFVAQNITIRLTVSLGVANCPKHTLTAEGLIKKADAAMYRAKELSKNTIRVAV